MRLDRPTMIAAALKLLDETGLDGLTLRRLAAEVGVQAPALYWHFKSKQELLDHMATAVLGQFAAEASLSSGLRWDRRMIESSRALRRILLRYRDGAKMVSGTRLMDTALYTPMEASLRALADAGFTQSQSVVALSTMASYVVGFVIEEQAVFPEPGVRDEFYDVEARSRRMDGQALPLAKRAGRQLFSNFDRRFEAGLKLIVAGMTAGKKTRHR
jgi:TetR/AcrR family transcriptional regulator, tetracycline repressor protein